METERALWFAGLTASMADGTFEPPSQSPAFELWVAGKCDQCGYVQGVTAPLVQSLQFSVATVCVRCGAHIESIDGAVRPKRSE